MRYDQLTMPLGDAQLVLKFHPRLTVLAGLSGSRRDALIETVTDLSRGALSNGSVELVDASGRHLTIDAANAGGGGALRRSRGDWRSILAVTSQDLGLAPATDDPMSIEIRTELDAVRRDAERFQASIDEAVAEQRRHAAQMDELSACEARLAELGSREDRVRHRRAHTLVELERLREMQVAVNALPGQIARDDALIDATNQILHLGDEWADVGERIDQIRSEIVASGKPFEPDSPPPGVSLAKMISRPDDVSERLTATIAERDGLRNRREDAKARLSEATTGPKSSEPADPRVLTLGVLDQETLWLTHRNLLLATEALHAAQREEESRLLADPTVVTRLEQCHEEAVEATETAERRWLPSMIAATFTAGSTILLLMVDLWIFLIPPLLVACIAICIAGIAVPRARARRALRRQSHMLDQLDVASLAEYRARLDDHPESERWLRAERTIVEYQAAHQDWQDLVGTITAKEAGALEASVHAWVADHDTRRHDEFVEATRHEIGRLNVEIKHVTARLAEMLEPYGLDPHTDALTAALTENVLQGRHARRLVAYGDATESEAKIRQRLTTELEALGFEDGDLSSRISAFGREMDAARRRIELRHEAAKHGDLDAATERLRAKLAAPLPPPSRQPSPGTTSNDRLLRDLRQRHGTLLEAVNTFQEPDTRVLERQLKRAQRRIATLEGSLDNERDLVVSNPVDHLVETLIRYRPAWPTTEHDPAPAWLDDPFAGTTPSLKRQLLNALVEVSNAVQVILLTGDPDVLIWAREPQQAGALDLIAPAGSRV